MVAAQEAGPARSALSPPASDRPVYRDFACLSANIVFEIDGATHSEDDEIAHDAMRTEYLERQGWMVQRFTNDDIYRRLGPVLDAIWTAIDARAKR